MKFHLTIIFLLITPFLFAQVNLVPNPSFENYTVCPNNMSQFDYVSGWVSYTISSDYYNACNNNIHSVSVPKNCIGYQKAADGNAYAGLQIYNSILSISPYREIIGCQLINSLVVNQKYYLSFKVNAADQNEIYTNNIGMMFSNKSFIHIYPDWPFDSVFIKNFSHLHSINVITDTANWTTIKGTFIADSAYKYLMIGNFYDDNHTVIIGGGSAAEVYYLIDEICVSTDSLTCNQPDAVAEINSINEKFNVYPNPATNELTIDCDLTDKSYFELYDVIGAKRKTVALDCGSQTKRIDLTDIDSGLYFYSVVDRKGNRIKTGKLVVIK